MPTHANLLQQMQSLTLPPGGVAIWGLGQMGVALKGSAADLVYLDPVLSDVVKITYPSTGEKFTRAFPPPLQPEEITNAGLVLCTHDHLDHTDPLTLTPLAQASPQGKFVVTAWAAEILTAEGIPAERLIVPRTGETLHLGKVQVTAIPAAHYEVEFDPLKGHRFFSYLVEMNGVRLLHSGDTLLYPGCLDALRQHLPIHVGILAVNGRDAYRESFDILGNLLPAEAAWLAAELQIDLLIPGHNDLFEFNTIRPGELADALAQHNPLQKYKVLRPGEMCYYLNG